MLIDKKKTKRGNKMLITKEEIKPIKENFYPEFTEEQIVISFRNCFNSMGDCPEDCPFGCICEENSYDYVSWIDFFTQYI